MSGPLILGQLTPRVALPSPDPDAVESLGPAVLVGRLPAEDPEGAWTYRTSSHQALAMPPNLEGRGLTPDALIWPLRKLATNRLQKEWILVGRSSSNDVMVNHTHVSKLHARIRLGEKDAWVSDAGSSNGTSVGIQKLQPEEPWPLPDGEWISLGGVMLTFMWRDTLLRLLQRPLTRK